MVRARLSVFITTIALAATSIVGTPALAAPEPHGVVATNAAKIAGGWLTEQFFDQGILQTRSNGEYVADYPTMADVVLGLDAAGVGQLYAANATQALFSNIDRYVGDGTNSSYVQPLAKSILVAEAQGLNPRAFGGRDLVAALESLQSPVTGRFSDKSSSGDHSNAISQSFAIIAERRAGRPSSVISNGLRALGTLQCGSGSFVLDFDSTGCLQDSQWADPQATAMAVLAGVDQTAHTATWTKVTAAVDYLLKVQFDNGQFMGRAPGENNTLSTALAAAAFAAVGVTGSATEPLSGALGAAQGVGNAQYSAKASAVYAGAVSDSDGSNVIDTTAVAIFGLAIFDNPKAMVSYETVKNDAAQDAPVPALPTGSFQPMIPFRVLDTRPAAIPAGATAVLHLPLQLNDDSPKYGNFPGGFTAVALNVTAVAPAASGFVSIYPTGTPRPNTSVLTTTAGVTTSSNTITAVGSDSFPSAISIYNGSNRPLQLVLDATGFIQPGDGRASGTYRAVTPVRLVDTRRTQRLRAGGSIGVSTVGPSAAAAAVSITAVNPRASGYLSASGGPVMTARTSTLNFTAGRTTTNGAIMALQGLTTFFITNHSGGDVDVLVDMTGYFVVGRPILPGTYVPVGPARLLDTRASRPVPAFGVVALQTEGAVGMPDTGIAAVAANVTAVAPSTGGYLIVAPYGGVRPPPSVSTINFQPTRVVADGVLSGIGPDGALAVYNASGRPVNVIIDVTGFFRSLPVSPLGY